MKTPSLRSAAARVVRAWDARVKLLAAPAGERGTGWVRTMNELRDSIEALDQCVIVASSEPKRKGARR